MEEPIFAFRSYIIRVTLHSMFFMFCIPVILIGAFSLLDSLVLSGYGIETNYFLRAILAILYFSIAPVLAGGFAGFTSSLLVCLLISQIVQDSNQDRLIYHFAAFAIVPFSFLLAFAGWYLVSLLFSFDDINVGWLLMRSLPTSALILIVHNFAFPHIFATPPKRKSKLEN